MKQKKVVNKGYTLTVKSWENDGDYSNTKQLTVDSIEDAKMYYEAVMLCSRKVPNSLGNKIDLNDEQYKCIYDFFMTYKEVLKDTVDIYNEIDFLMSSDDYDDKDEIAYAFSDFVGDLLGWSEFYSFRVCESVTITYSPEDIYVEEIKFD